MPTTGRSWRRSTASIVSSRRTGRTRTPTHARLFSKRSCVSWRRIWSLPTRGETSLSKHVLHQVPASNVHIRIDLVGGNRLDRQTYTDVAAGLLHPDRCVIQVHRGTP